MGIVDIVKWLILAVSVWFIVGLVKPEYSPLTIINNLDIFKKKAGDVKAGGPGPDENTLV